MASKKRGRKKGGSKRRTRRSASGANCEKIASKAGISIACDDTPLRRAVTEAKREASNVRGWAAVAAKQGVAQAREHVKSAEKALKDFHKSRASQMKVGRGVIAREAGTSEGSATSRGAHWVSPYSRFGRISRRRR